MKITIDMVESVASLGRLEYSEAEMETLTKQLDGILTYVEKLNELDTTGVEPTSHVLRISNVFREDAPRPSLSQDDALGNAPDRAGENRREHACHQRTGGVGVEPLREHAAQLADRHHAAAWNGGDHFEAMVRYIARCIWPGVQRLAAIRMIKKIRTTPRVVEVVLRARAERRRQQFTAD